MATHGADGTLMSDLVRELARVQSQLDDLAQKLAEPSGLTSARWKVLGAVSGSPAPAAHVARAMGLTRQAVQQTADALYGEGLISYRDNPHHKRAKLLEVTALGKQRLGTVDARYVACVNRLARRLGRASLEAVLAGIRGLATEVARERARRADKI